MSGLWPGNLKFMQDSMSCLILRPGVQPRDELEKIHSCHSEERSDEESFLANVLKNKIFRFARNDNLIEYAFIYKSLHLKSGFLIQPRSLNTGVFYVQ